MHNRNGRGGYRGPATSRSRRPRRNPSALIALIAVGAAVPVVSIGYFLTSPGARHLASVADVQNAEPGSIVPSVAASRRGTPSVAASGPATRDAGGWGRGGYPMMPGPVPDAGPGGVGSGAEVVNPPASGPASGLAAVTDVASENWAGYAATGAPGSWGGATRPSRLSRVRSSGRRRSSPRRRATGPCCRWRTSAR